MERADKRQLLRTSQRVLTAAAAVLLVAGLVGLVVAQPPTLSRLAVGNGSTVVPAAAARTSGKSFQTEFTIRTAGMKIGTVASDIQVAGTGAFDPVGRRGYLTMHESGSAVSATLAKTNLQLVIAPDALYQTDPLARNGKHWIKAPLPASTNGWMTGSGADLTQALAALQQNSSDFRRVGSDKIRGVLTAHYKLTLAPPNVGTIRMHFPSDAWVDTDGRLRRLQFQVDLAQLVPAGQPGVTSLGTLQASFDFFGFGVAVPDRTPPANDVGDLAATATQSSATASLSPACQQQMQQYRASGQGGDPKAMSELLQSMSKACANH